MNQDYNYILDSLPYQDPFLFVDELISVSNETCEGKYRFLEDAFFYKGHFKNHPVTPGVIITECMAQIGVVCLGIFILKDSLAATPQLALSSHTVDFYKPVYPGETVTVLSEKHYFRFQKLQCAVKMLNEKGELVAKGTISGMVSH